MSNLKDSYLQVSVKLREAEELVVSLKSERDRLYSLIVSGNSVDFYNRIAVKRDRCRRIKEALLSFDKPRFTVRDVFDSINNGERLRLGISMSLLSSHACSLVKKKKLVIVGRVMRSTSANSMSRKLLNLYEVTKV